MRCSAHPGVRTHAAVAEQIPEAVFELHDLESLSLSQNELEHLPSALGRLTHLRKLGVNDNQLSEEGIPQELSLLTGAFGRRRSRAEASCRSDAQSRVRRPG